jgi:hypothetical protein
MLFLTASEMKGATLFATRLGLFTMRGAPRNSKRVMPRSCIAKILKAAAAFLGVVGFASYAHSAGLCRIPFELRAATPATAPKPVPYETIWRQGVSFEGFQLGIGALHPQRDEDRTWNWIKRIELPLSKKPWIQPFAWIVEGWLVQRSRKAVPFTSAGMIETGYEVPSFIVLKRRADGWLRIRYLPPGRGNGTAWLHTCALSNAGLELVFTPWSEWFLKGAIAPLHFRSTIPHVLRARPTSDARHLALIMEDHHLEPIRVKGEWMRVKVVQPSTYCREDVEADARKGWVRWFSAEKGPWVWYPSRGC